MAFDDIAPPSKGAVGESFPSRHERIRSRTRLKKFALAEPDFVKTTAVTPRLPQSPYGVKEKARCTIRSPRKNAEPAAASAPSPRVKSHRPPPPSVMATLMAPLSGTRVADRVAEPTSDGKRLPQSQNQDQHKNQRIWPSEQGAGPIPARPPSMARINTLSGPRPKTRSASALELDMGPNWENRACSSSFLCWFDQPPTPQNTTPTPTSAARPVTAKVPPVHRMYPPPASRRPMTAKATPAKGAHRSARGMGPPNGQAPLQRYSSTAHSGQCRVELDLKGASGVDQELRLFEERAGIEDGSDDQAIQNDCEGDEGDSFIYTDQVGTKPSPPRFRFSPAFDALIQLQLLRETSFLKRFENLTRDRIEKAWPEYAQEGTNPGLNLERFCRMWEKLLGDGSFGDVRQLFRVFDSNDNRSISRMEFDEALDFAYTLRSPNVHFLRHFFSIMCMNENRPSEFVTRFELLAIMREYESVLDARPPESVIIQKKQATIVVRRIEGLPWDGEQKLALTELISLSKQDPILFDAFIGDIPEPLPEPQTPPSPTLEKIVDRDPILSRIELPPNVEDYLPW